MLSLAVSAAERKGGEGSGLLRCCCNASGEGEFRVPDFLVLLAFVREDAVEVLLPNPPPLPLHEDKLFFFFWLDTLRFLAKRIVIPEKMNDGVDLSLQDVGDSGVLVKAATIDVVVVVQSPQNSHMLARSCSCIITMSLTS